MHNIGKIATRSRSFSFPNVFNKAKNLLSKVSSEQPPDSFESSEASAKKESWGKRFVSKITSLVKPKPRSVKNDEQGVAEEQIRDVNYSDINNSIDKEACEREKTAKTELEEAEKIQQNEKIKKIEKKAKNLVDTNRRSLDDNDKDFAEEQIKDFNYSDIKNSIDKKACERVKAAKIELEEAETELEEAKKTQQNEKIKKLKKEVKAKRAKVKAQGIIPVKILDKNAADLKETYIKFIVEKLEPLINQANADMARNKNDFFANCGLNHDVNYINHTVIEVQRELTPEEQNEQLSKHNAIHDKIMENILPQLYNEREKIGPKNYENLLGKLCQNIANVNDNVLPNVIADYKRLIHQILEKAPTEADKKETFNVVLKYMVKCFESSIDQTGEEMVKSKKAYKDYVHYTEKTSVKETERLRDAYKTILFNMLQQLSETRENGEIDSESYTHLLEKLCEKIAIANENPIDDFKDYESIIVEILKKTNNKVKKEAFRSVFKSLIGYLNQNDCQKISELDEKIMNIYSRVIEHDMHILIKEDMDSSNNDNLSKQVQNPPRRLITDFTSSLNDIKNNDMLFQIESYLSENMSNKSIEAYGKIKGEILFAKNKADYEMLSNEQLINIIKATIKDVTRQTKNKEEDNELGKIINDNLQTLIEEIKAGKMETESPFDFKHKIKFSNLNEIQNFVNQVKDKLGNIKNVEPKMQPKFQELIETVIKKLTNKAETEYHNNATNAAKEEYINKGYRYGDICSKYLLASIGRIQIPREQITSNTGSAKLNNIYTLHRTSMYFDTNNNEKEVLSPTAAFTKARQYIQNLGNNLSEDIEKYQKIIEEYNVNVNNVLEKTIGNIEETNCNMENLAQANITPDSKKKMQTELQNYTYRLILIAFINFQKIADQDTTNDKRYCASLKHTLNAFIKFYQNKFGTLDGSVNSVYKNCQDWIEKKT